MMKPLRNDFCVFVISHNNPDNDTYKQLQLCNCKYPIYIVIDDKDPALNRYVSKYGEDKVLIFSKSEYENKCDMMDNFNFDKVIVYARNACFDFAEKLGYKYFLELDDDYNEFAFRFGTEKWVHLKDSCIDEVFTAYVDYYEQTPIRMLAFMQGGDFSDIRNGKIVRKAMNCLFCSTDRKVVFNGRMNEDVNTYIRLNSLGLICISFPFITIHQRASQTGNGMSETYDKYGTYVKSFYSVIQNPAFVKISILQSPSSYRIHHNINHKYSDAKIISSKYKKN